MSEHPSFLERELVKSAKSANQVALEYCPLDKLTSFDSKHPLYDKAHRKHSDALERRLNGVSQRRSKKQLGWQKLKKRFQTFIEPADHHYASSTLEFATQAVARLQEYSLFPYAIDWKVAQQGDDFRNQTNLGLICEQSATLVHVSKESPRFSSVHVYPESIPSIGMHHKNGVNRLLFVVVPAYQNSALQLYPSLLGPLFFSATVNEFQSPRETREAVLLSSTIIGYGLSTEHLAETQDLPASLDKKYGMASFTSNTSIAYRWLEQEYRTTGIIQAATDFIKSPRQWMQEVTAYTAHSNDHLTTKRLQ